MKDAVINSDESKSLITTEDMFAQIGRLVIENLNIVKIYQQLINKYEQEKLMDKQTISQLNQDSNSLESLTRQVNALKLSNEQYQKNNTKLADRIKDLTKRSRKTIKK